MHLFDGKGVADDVLREPLKIIALMGLNALAAMDAEIGVLPSKQHPRAFGRQQSLIDEKGDGTCTEQFLQRSYSGFGQNVEPAATHKEAVSDECVQVRVKIEVFTEGVNGHDCDDIEPDRIFVTARDGGAGAPRVGSRR